MFPAALNSVASQGDNFAIIRFRFFTPKIGSKPAFPLFLNPLHNCLAVVEGFTRIDQMRKCPNLVAWI